MLASSTVDLDFGVTHDNNNLKELHIQCRMIGLATEPLHNEYSKGLKHMRTQMGSVEWQADEALGAWCESVIRIVHCLSNLETLAKVGIVVDGLASELDHSIPDCDDELQISRCTTFFRLVLHLVSARCWSTASSSTVFPDCFCGILSQHSRPHAEASLVSIRRKWEVHVFPQLFEFVCSHRVPKRV